MARRYAIVQPHGAGRSRRPGGGRKRAESHDGKLDNPDVYPTFLGRQIYPFHLTRHAHIGPTENPEAPGASNTPGRIRESCGLSRRP